MRLRVRPVFLLAGLLAPVIAGADGSVSKDDFKKYAETQQALQDPRVQKMPEARRVPEIARVNFKMNGAALQAILEKVEAAGGAEGLSKKGEDSVKKAIDALELKDRLKEIKVDTGSPHVITYVKWTADAKTLAEEAVLLAIRTADASPIASTVYLWAVDENGQDLWRAKFATDRVRHIQEKRIADWARTRYMRLFEVDVDATGGSASGGGSAASTVGP